MQKHVHVHTLNYKYVYHGGPVAEYTCTLREVNAESGCTFCAKGCRRKEKSGTKINENTQEPEQEQEKQELS